jgi:hypothetical protein
VQHADRIPSQSVPRAARTWRGKIGLYVIFIAMLTIVAFLNPIRESDSRKAPTKLITYDQQIVIPKIPGGASSMRPLAEEAADPGDQLGLVSRWTPIKNGDDPGQLLVDVPSIHLWRKVERNAWFQYIPKPHTLDENRNKPILYELISDSFKCADGTAVKLRLNVYYEDGTQQDYFP